MKPASWLSLLLFLAMPAQAGVNHGPKLKAFLNGGIPASSLEITYDDIHGLWGGIRISVRGDGKVVQEARNRKAPPASDLSPKEVRDLVRLVLDLKAWRQAAPERAPRPDESRSYLRIKIGSEKSEVWEWFNEMERNNRLLRIKKFMQERSSKAPG